MLSTDDRHEIDDVLALHGHLFDRGHLDRLHEIFTPEVVYDLSDAGVGTFEGIDAVRAAAIRLGDDNPLAHHVTNVVIAEQTADEVTVHSKGLVIMADGTLSGVDHRDTLRRHDGHWRISRRVVTAALRGRTTS